MAFKSAHPGFKAVAESIASKGGFSRERAGAILASRTRDASEKAKKKNPRLRRVLGTLLLTLAIPSISYAQKSLSLNTDRSQETILIWMGCEGTNCAGTTVDNTAGGVTLTSTQFNPAVGATFCPSGTNRGMCQAQVAFCSNAGAKIWVSSALTSAVTLASGDGQPFNDGTTFTIYGFTNISNFHAIRDAGSSSTLRCDYYRQP